LLSAETTTSTRTGNQALVREINLSIILSTLPDRAPISRAKLAAVTGLNKATVSSLIRELLKAEFVHEIGLGKAGGSGRPAIMLELNPRAGCLIGAEVGPDFISVVLTNFAAKTLWRYQEATTHFARYEDIAKRLVTIIQDAWARAEHDNQRVLGMGLGVSGLSNQREAALHNIFEREFSFPVYVDKAANLAIIGETYWGVARGRQNVLYFSSGPILDVAMISNGHVLPQIQGLAGEVGHMTIDVDGPICQCGNRGCWQVFASESAVLLRVRQAIADGKPTRLAESAHSGSDALTILEVVQAAQANDPVAVDALKETGRYVGIGLVNLITAFNPDVIVIGGSLSVASDLLLPEVNREIERRAARGSQRIPEVRIAAHGPDACVMGGIAVAYQQILSQPKLTRTSKRPALENQGAVREIYN
jgi:predicted NBD/HSP70 family sugar kinase